MNNKIKMTYKHQRVGPWTADSEMGLSTQDFYQEELLGSAPVEGRGTPYRVEGEAELW